MSWSILAGLPNPVIVDAAGTAGSGYVLKAYLPGTTTSTSLAIDSAGSSPQASITANADGIWEVSGNEVAPYIDRTCKWGIFINATDAAANTPFYMGPFDNVEAVASRSDISFAKNFATLAEAIADTLLIDGDLVIIGDRENAEFNVVLAASVTIDTHGVIQCTGVGTLALDIVLKPTMSTVNFGAVTTAAVNNTAAIQAAVDTRRKIYHDIVSEASGPIEMSNNYHLAGTGTILKKGSISYVASDTNTYDPLIVFKTGQTKIVLEGITCADGDQNVTTKVSSADCVLFEFGFRNKLLNLKIDNFNYGVRNSDSDMFLLTLEGVVINSCEYGFDFANSASAKTTFTFKNCYANNCGTGYNFNNFQYSVLDTCAADYIADKDASNPIDGVGRGSRAATTGVFHFQNCSAISVNGCGTESSYGNGGIHQNASTVAVNGLRIYLLKSTYLPIYASVPEYYVGPIMSGSEAGVGGGFTIDGLSMLSAWENNVATASKQAVIVNNHNNGAYGIPSGIIINANVSDDATMGTAAKAVGGAGYVNNVRLTGAKNTLNSGSRLVFTPIVIAAASLGTVLSIPFLSQGSNNRVSVVSIQTLSNTYNTTTPLVGTADIECTSLTTLNATIVNSGGNVASVSSPGLA